MSKSSVNSFQISQDFNAKVDLLYRVWTEREDLKNWMHPEGCSIKYNRCDVGPGRTNHYCLIGSDGKEIWGKIIYRQLIKSKYLEYIQSFSDEKEGVTRHPLFADWPLELLITISFADQGLKSRIDLQIVPVNASDSEIAAFNGAHPQMEQGWNGTFLQLEKYLDKLLRPNK